MQEEIIKTGGINENNWMFKCVAVFNHVEFAEFLQKDLAIEKRVNSLMYYKDLIEVSKWFRDFSEELIKKAGLENSTRFRKFLSKMHKARLKNEEIPLNQIQHCEKLLTR